jgi:hypothetical protein
MRRKEEERNMAIRYVLSIDPGGHNGYCLATKHGMDWNIEDVDSVDKNQLYKLLERFADGHEDDALVIYEQYKLYADKAKAMIGNEFETVQIIGVIKYITQRRGIKWIQSPTSSKAFWTDKRLKGMGLYVPIDHKRDAIRHFLYWLYFTNKGADLEEVLRLKN